MTSRSRWGREGPPEEAYGRVTNPERFAPLHDAALEMIGRLEADFDVERAEGYGLDEGLEGNSGLARPSVKLSPTDPEAAPMTVVFTDFPGLFVRFGRWADDPFPDCGCDACGGTAEEEIESLTEKIHSLTTSGLCETVEAPRGRFGGDGSLEAEWRGPSSYERRWSRIDDIAEEEIERLTEKIRSLTTSGLCETVDAPRGRFGGDGSLEVEWRGPSSYERRWSRIDRDRARQMSGGRRRLVLDWKPWPRRKA